MQISESIINNFLNEIDTLTYRLRNIKQCFNSSSNIRLKERLIFENSNISDRVREIYKVAQLLNKRISQNISFSALLLEKSKRALKEAENESNLFLL